MSAAAAEELGRLLAKARLPLSFTVLEDYAEIHDAAGDKVALSVKPHLILALNALPGLLAERAALVEALTPSGETKAHYSGEFFFEVDHYDEESQEVLSRRVTVPWTTVKEIMSAIRARALVGGQADGK